MAAGPARLVFATRNRGKLAELRALLAGLAVEVASLDELGVTGEVEEDGATFADNARKKAEAAVAATGLPALADDSGLEVDALGGAPGVQSARYAGPRSSDAEHRAHLAAALATAVASAPELGAAPRTARFRCVLALAWPGRPTIFEEGACEGVIAAAPRGDGGFGYDALFVPRGETRTMAELTFEEKNRLSHRGAALRRMRPHVEQALAAPAAPRGA